MKKPFALKSRGLFDPSARKPFKVSRSGIESFLECPRCFFLNNRLGIRRPSGPPFNINVLVDKLLKKEFDVHRANHTVPPLLAKHGLDFVPFAHAQLDDWRENFKGVQVNHEASGLLFAGAVDDLWVNRDGAIIVVDYKATAKAGEVSLDAEWQDAYRRQMEMYQWLVRGQGLKVSNTGYFVYCNGQDADAFNGRIEFSISLLTHTGNDGWVEKALMDASACLRADAPPAAPGDCEFCGYVTARRRLEV
jgi:hypothetical protein